jgi:hypothetical protein
VAINFYYWREARGQEISLVFVFVERDCIALPQEERLVSHLGALLGWPACFVGSSHGQSPDMNECLFLIGVCQALWHVGKTCVAFR